MEGWSNIMYDVANSFTIFSVLYFIVCVFIGSFFMIQLTLAVIKAKFSGTQQNKEEVVEEEYKMDIIILLNFRKMMR